MLYMDRWESLIDQKIREAMEQGEFNDLSGKGSPIDLAENPYEDPDWRTAHRLLRNAGFAPSWIEERKEIEAELETARTRLIRARELYHVAGGESSTSAVARWEKSLSTFREQLGELKMRITKWNAIVPAAGFQRRQINTEVEIETVIDGDR